MESVSGIIRFEIGIRQSKVRALERNMRSTLLAVALLASTGGLAAPDPPDPRECKGGMQRGMQRGRESLSKIPDPLSLPTPFHFPSFHFQRFPTPFHFLSLPGELIPRPMAGRARRRNEAYPFGRVRTIAVSGRGRSASDGFPPVISVEQP
jgi:hypothetical protein